jgi:glutathione S-transferase
MDVNRETVILHHYDFSNYSEKIRLIFGLKSIVWQSVTIPSYGAKPSYTALTGGYRRTPSLQIGADIYCDTYLIIEVLEYLFPSPSLYPGMNKPRVKMLCESLVYWAEKNLMRSIALYITGLHAEDFPEEFHEDRARLHYKAPPTLSAVKNAANRYLPQVVAQIPLIEELLVLGEDYIFKEGPSLADVSLYQCPWFLNIVGGDSHLLNGMPKVLSWMKCVESLGHGSCQQISPARALEIARASVPAQIGAGCVSDCEQIILGSQVVVGPFGESSAASGVLVYADEKRITLAHTGKECGLVHVHFPRYGYWIKAAL